MFNRVEIVDLLLAHGANVLAQDSQGRTALAAARAMGAPDTPDRLVEAAKRQELTGG